MNLQIKKKFVKPWQTDQYPQMVSEAASDQLKTFKGEISKLEGKVGKLEAENLTLEKYSVELGNRLKEAEFHLSNFS